MNINRHEIIINCPVPMVFNFIARFENVLRYIETMQESFQTSEGPPGVGTTGLEVAGPPFKGMRFEWVITEFEQDTRIKFLNKGPMPFRSKMDHSVLYEFEAVPEGTRLKSTHTAQLFGPLRLFTFFFLNWDRRARHAMLVRIKRILEEEQSSASRPETPR